MRRARATHSSRMSSDTTYDGLWAAADSISCPSPYSYGTPGKQLAVARGLGRIPAPHEVNAGKWTSNTLVPERDIVRDVVTGEALTGPPRGIFIDDDQPIPARRATVHPSESPAMRPAYSQAFMRPEPKVVNAASHQSTLPSPGPLGGGSRPQSAAKQMSRSSSTQVYAQHGPKESSNTRHHTRAGPALRCPSRPLSAASSLSTPQRLNLLHSSPAKSSAAHNLRARRGGCTDPAWRAPSSSMSGYFNSPTVNDESRTIPILLPHKLDWVQVST